jgi:hypothetical protein
MKHTESLDLVFTYKDYTSTQTATQGDKNNLEHYKELAADEIREAVKQEFEDATTPGEIAQDITADDLELDKSDLPGWLQDEDTLSELLENWDSYNELEVYEAAHEAGSVFDDDEDFARDMAEQVGAIDKNATWPHSCIDWDLAAQELMYDYSESNGHYFRNR